MGHSDAPSPMVPLCLVGAMVGMAFLPWLMSYMAAVVNALHQVNGAVFLWPLLIILGISLVSTYHQWMSPAPSSSTSASYQRRNREWRGGASDYIGTQQQPSDGSGVGLFILLVFALVLIPWK